MAVAAPARKTAPAPAPSRTTPPKKRKRAAAAPRGRAAAPAPARKAPARRAPARAPQRARPKSKPRSGTQPRLALVVGRTAVAVRQLPDSGLVVRMTRGRAWIGVLGVLLAGIVALNVMTLSFAASSGEIDQQTSALEQENSILSNRDEQRSGIGRVRQAAASLGLSTPSSADTHFTDAGPDVVAKAAARLAAMGS